MTEATNTVPVTRYEIRVISEEEPIELGEQGQTLTIPAKGSPEAEWNLAHYKLNKALEEVKRLASERNAFAVNYAYLTYAGVDGAWSSPGFVDI
jgi:hypothetical protein